MRETYVTSELLIEKRPVNGSIYRFGNLVLTRWAPRLARFRWHDMRPKDRPVVFAELTGPRKVSFACTHTTAYQKYRSSRERQLRELKMALEGFGAESYCILGDLNLHDRCEDKVILDLGLLDAWAETHFQSQGPFSDQHEGYTFDAERNPFISNYYIPGEVRRMRLDRILFSPNLPLQPSSPCIMWADSAINERGIFISDHFGLCITMRPCATGFTGDPKVREILQENSERAPVDYRRSLYANTVSIGLYAAWLLGRAPFYAMGF